VKNIILDSRYCFPRDTLKSVKTVISQLFPNFPSTVHDSDENEMAKIRHCSHAAFAAAAGGMRQQQTREDIAVRMLKT
jgi:hypothetical protein